MDKEKLLKKKQRVKEEGNMHQLAEVTNDLGNSYYGSGNLSKALEEYLEVVKVSEISGVNLKCVVAYRRIGEISNDLGKYECAIKHLNLCLEGAKKLNNEVEEQRGLNNLGRTYFLLSQTLPERSARRVKALANARKVYNESILLCDKLQDISTKEVMTMRARLFLNQGLVLEAQKMPIEGINLIKSAIDLFEDQKSSTDLHRAYLALEGLYEKQGDINQAIKILDLAAKTENVSRKVEAILAKAELFLKNGKWMNAHKILVDLRPVKGMSQSARKELEKWLRLAETLCRGEEELIATDMNTDYLKLCEVLGDAAVTAGCYNKALEYYQEMLEHAENTESKEKISAALVSLALTFKDAGQYKEALHMAERELEMCSNPGEVCKTTLLLAGFLESAGSTSSKIIKTFELAMSKAETCKDPSLEAEVLQAYLHYLDSHKSEIQTKLDLLLEKPVPETHKKISPSPDIEADIHLDEFSDIGYSSDGEENKDEPSTSTSRKRKRFSIRRNLKGETSLHLACSRGNKERVQKLLEDGHPVDVRDYDGWRPLHEAANYGFVEIVKLLIDAGADINDPGGRMGEGLTPLHDAALGGSLDVMNLLIDKGADVHAITEAGDSTLDCLVGWRERVKVWNGIVESEYKCVYNKLVAMGVQRRKKKKSMDGQNGNRNDSVSLDKD